jgi:hypothetical protein
MQAARLDFVWLTAAGGVFCALLFGGLSTPLMWQDEAETAVYASRIVDYGIPKVHGDRNVVYEFGPNAALGVDERTDAYIGTTWGHFYFAVPGALWARSTHDVYSKTFRIRLLFAAVGAFGVALFAFAVWPLFAGSRSRALRFAAAFMLLCAGSISLLLHLREARYYPLLIFTIGAIASVHFRHVVFETLSRRGYALAICALLVGLFNVFYSAFFSVGLLLVVDAIWREGVERRGQPDPAKRVALALAPLALALLLVVPELIFFETLEIAAAFSQHLGLSFAGYVSNLGQLARHLVQHELAVAALLVRVAVVVSDRLGSATPGTVAGQMRSIVNRLALFGTGYTLIGCLNPLVYERYFVLLAPLLTLIFVLDSCALLDRLPTRSAPRRLALTALFAISVIAAPQRLADVQGRWNEIREPVRGPVDFAVEWIRAHYSDPESLVIATNYENHPYMYYLGSHVIVGLSRSNIRRDRLLVPDLVIPRRRWSSSLPDALGFLKRGNYEAVPLDVRDLHYNNIPALSRSPSTPDPHRFETALARTDEQRLQLYVRTDSRGPTEPRP